MVTSFVGTTLSSCAITAPSGGGQRLRGNRRPLFRQHGGDVGIFVFLFERIVGSASRPRILLLREKRARQRRRIVQSRFGGGLRTQSNSRYGQSRQQEERYADLAAHVPR